MRRVSNACLTRANSFGLESTAEELLEVSSVEELLESLEHSPSATILGEGSNVVLHRHLPGLVIRVRIRGILVKRVDESAYRIRVGAGERWNELVRSLLGRGIRGLENLSLIPGSVGAAPYQNIGAYGRELGPMVESVEVVDRVEMTTRTLPAAECEFRYRDSVFKSGSPKRYVITYVNIRTGDQAVETGYPDIDTELRKLGCDRPNPIQVARAVIRVRRRKLPDPRLIGNVGSFFKNPLLSSKDFELLRGKCEIQGFEERGLVKVSAARLIEASGWKGFRDGAVAVWHRQPLVLINTGGATATNVLGLADRIVDDVHRRYGVALDREPIEIGRP
ncbi:MAG: UDP-N-acetylenolpyruvoylglucosamine reductase [Gammaproteobacteria bacterium]|nr:UDP-N-acetylenolpyruvoylglucosamine reductase [Gammaproteobacteria bacterium]